MKTTRKVYSQPLTMAKIKRPTTPNVGTDVKQLDCWWERKKVQPLGELFSSFL